MRKEKGFTLLELVIVITVIGILIGAVLPKVNNVTGTANKSTALSDMNALQSAIIMAYGQGQVDKSKTIIVDEVEVSLNSKGYPYKLGSGANEVSGQNCQEVFELLLRITNENKYESSSDKSTCIYQYDGNKILYNTDKGSVTYEG